jgi:hypothetical protein
MTFSTRHPILYNFFRFLIISGASCSAAVSQTSFPSDEPAPPALSVEIVAGPVVEQVTATTAVIAWSTNVNSGTVLRYGTDPQHLDQTAGMPWGGLTHRVYLKDLKPDTRYYFQAESPKGQGTGTSATAPSTSFRTKVAVACTGRCA